MKLSIVATRLSVCLAAATLAFGGAASYNITLYQPSVIDGKELKAGDYKIEMKDHSAVIRQGKTAIETEFKTQTADRKYSSTSVKYNVEGGKNNIQEIRLGGTKTKLVFEAGKSANGGS